MRLYVNSYKYLLATNKPPRPKQGIMKVTQISEAEGSPEYSQGVPVSPGDKTELSNYPE